MNALAILAVVLVAAAPARAQAGPAARIGALVESAPQLGGAAIPPLSSIPVPAAPAATAPAAAPALPPVPSVVPAALWATLKAPDASTLAWLSSRIPGLNAGAVRVLPLEAADAIFAAAVAHDESPLDLFTDAGFRGQAVFYLAQADIQTIFTRYEIRVLTPPSGLTKDGKPYATQALVMGGGRVDSLYDRDQFDFANPLFPDNTYKSASHVTQRIQGPGDVAVDGVWVHVGIFTPAIQRVVKLSATEGRVETSLGSRTKPVSVIRRR